MNAAHLIQSILTIASAPPAVILVFKHLVTVYFLRGFSFFVFFSFFSHSPKKLTNREAEPQNESLIERERSLDCLVCWNKGRATKATEKKKKPVCGRRQGAK